jgi:chaperonin cofactor prefoldin
MMGPTRDEEEDDDDGNIAAPPAGILLWHGETFFECDEDEATAFCEVRIESLQRQLDALQQEAAEIQTQQTELKDLLYGRFGKSINLEAD